MTYKFPSIMDWVAPHHTFKQISENVYYLSHGDHDRPAIGVILGSEATLLVDAGNSNHHANVVLDFLSDLSQKREVSPIRYVVLTHWHWDHSFGAVGYETAFENDHSEVGYPVIIGHHLTTTALKQQQSYTFSDDALQQRVDQGSEIEFIQKYMKLEYPDLSMIDIRTPKLSYQSKLVIDLGDLNVVIDHIDSDHASDSSLIYVRDSHNTIQARTTLFLGDCLYPDLYRGETFTVEKLSEVLDKLSLYPADIYVDAHDLPWVKSDFSTLSDDYSQIISYFRDHSPPFGTKEEILEEIKFSQNRSEEREIDWKDIQRYVIQSFLNYYGT